MQPMTYEEYLAHHGILGMKWGKRNGPPYPLNEAQMTPKERAKNEVSEYAAKAYAARKKAKIREKELVRKHKFEEKEARRQNRVDERESRRQNKVDEKEVTRQNRVDEREMSKQNDADMAEKWEQYKRGRKYVRNFLIGAGVMTVAGLAVYKAVKSGKGDIETVGKVTQGIAEKANLVTTLGKKAETGIEWPKQSFDNVVGSTGKGRAFELPKPKATSTILQKAGAAVANNAKSTKNVKMPSQETVKKAETFINNLKVMKEKTYASPDAVKVIQEGYERYKNYKPAEDLSKVLMDPKKWAYGGK